MTKKDQSTAALAGLFRVLGDPTRLAILRLLLESERNVSAVCEALKMPQPSISHHLGVLRTGGLVRTRRSGKEIHYSLRDVRRDRSGKTLKSMLNGAPSVKIGPFVMAMADD